jgi:hypothetical protein
MSPVISQTAVAGPRPTWFVWAGRLLTALPIAMMLMSAAMKIAAPPQVTEAFVGKYGYPERSLPIIALLELVCIALYAFPRTAVIGAVLVTGYLGGAVATHVRAGEPFIAPFLLGVIAWGGLYFRDERIRTLLPFRQPRSG